MKKKVFGRKFSRDFGSRKALLRSLTRALLLSGTIDTTKAKAQAMQPDIDALVNLAKDKSVTKRRQAYAMLGNDRLALDMLVDRVAPVFEKRTGGYTRIVNLPDRAGDRALRARIEWVEKVEIKNEKSKIKNKKSLDQSKKAEKPKSEKKGTLNLLKREKKEISSKK